MLETDPFFGKNFFFQKSIKEGEYLTTSKNLPRRDSNPGSPDLESPPPEDQRHNHYPM